MYMRTEVYINNTTEIVDYHTLYNGYLTPKDTGTNNYISIVVRYFSFKEIYDALTAADQSRIILCCIVITKLALVINKY